MTCSLSFWLQMSEPITPLDTDNCMTKEQVTLIQLHICCVLFTPLKEMINYHSL